MSDGRRTREEYLERYAKSYTGGDVEAAEGHAIVAAFLSEINSSQSKAHGSDTVVQSAVYGN